MDISRIRPVFSHLRGQSGDVERLSIRHERGVGQHDLLGLDAGIFVRRLPVFAAQFVERERRIDCGPHGEFL